MAHNSGLSVYRERMKKEDLSFGIGSNLMHMLESLLPNGSLKAPPIHGILLSCVSALHELAQ